MYKVFNNDFLIIINEKEINDLSVNNKFFVKNTDDLQEFVKNYFSGNNNFDVLIYGYNTEDMFSDFKKQFHYIKAAGGIVVNNNDEYLCIKRLGFWDFPKGKIEKNETAEVAAIREVEEETAVLELKIINQLNSSFHIYPHKGKLVLKKTFWFEMKTNYTGMLSPQIEEDIDLVVWKTKREVNLLLQKSYRSLKEGFKGFFN